MYPRLTNRFNTDGKQIYTYACNIKLRSKRAVCNRKNANGNSLDMEIIEQIKELDDNKYNYIDELEKSRKFYGGNRESYEEQLSALRKEKSDIEKKMDSLVDSLAELGEREAKYSVAKRIEQLGQESRDVELRISELMGLVSQNRLADIEFDLMRQLVKVFKNGIDEMTVEQKRMAIRTLVRKVVWDGKAAHVFLFGSQDGEIEYPDISTLICDDEAEDYEDDLESFADEEPENESVGDKGLGKCGLPGAEKLHWGEGSK